jgi:hypothetical protein
VPTDLEALDDHINQLCERHGIRREESARSGRAIRQRETGVRTIRVPPIRSQLGYLICLHEAAHHLGRGRSAPRLEAEANAWLWALEHSVVEPTAATRRGIGLRLRSYLRWAESRQYRKVPPRIPAADHPFWTLVAWDGKGDGAPDSQHDGATESA